MRTWQTILLLSLLSFLSSPLLYAGGCSDSCEDDEFRRMAVLGNSTELSKQEKEILLQMSIGMYQDNQFGMKKEGIYFQFEQEQFDKGAMIIDNEIFPKIRDSQDRPQKKNKRRKAQQSAA